MSGKKLAKEVEVIGTAHNGRRISYDDEIDLKPLFISLWRNRILLLCAMLAGGVLGVIYAYTMPDEYEVKMLFRPSIISQKPGSAPVYFTSLQSVKGEFEAGVFDFFLEHSKEENGNSLKAQISCRLPQNSGSVEFYYVGPKKELASNSLESLTSYILENDSKRLSFHKEQLLIDRKHVELSQREIQDELIMTESELIRVDNVLKEIVGNISEGFESNTKQLSSGIESLSDSELSREALHKALLYTNMVIQSRQILSELSMKESEVINRKSNLLRQREKLKRDVLEIGIKLLDIDRKLNGIVPSKILVKTTDGAQGPVGPKRYLIVFFFVCAGLFLGLLGCVIRSLVINDRKR